VRINRRRSGAIRLRLEAGEASGLVALLDDLVTLVRSGAPDDPALERLFPAAYLDDEQAAEFRELTGSTLLDERIQRVAACRAELRTDGEGEHTLELDAAAATRWIQVLNDLRLAMGTRLEISEDDPPELDPADPDVQARAVYHWLTWMQDGLVRALMK
jgi:hypothetical protein